MMGYATTSTYGAMGCLADIYQIFNNEGEYGDKDIEVSLYTGGSSSSIPDQTGYPIHGTASERLEWKVNVFKDVCGRAARALSAGVFLDAAGRDEAIETGKITIRSASHPAVIHARLAPFRIFIERPDRITFFNQAEQYGAMGAFIACHVYAVDQTALILRPDTPTYVRDPGHHQSMFCHMQATRSGLLFSDAIRRIAALHPSLRHHLVDDEGTTMKETYVVPQLKDESLASVLKALRKAGFDKKNVPDPNESMQATVEHFQLWHDTIVKQLSK